MTFQDWMLDKRVLKRNILNGTITREDYHKYLESLPDMQNNIAEEDDEEVTESDDEEDVEAIDDESPDSERE